MGLLSFEDARKAISRLIEVSSARGEPIGTPIVVVGGTAMAAWNVRSLSKDIDLFAPSISAEAVEQVENELRDSFGPTFRIDATSTENIWGSILVRDIAASPLLERLPSGHELRALGIADLYLLKLASGREHDRADLELLALRTDADELVPRWNQLVQWHGNRSAVLGYADAFVTELADRYSIAPLQLIDRLAVTSGQRRELRAAYGVADDAR